MKSKNQNDYYKARYYVFKFKNSAGLWYGGIYYDQYDDALKAYRQLKACNHRPRMIEVQYCDYRFNILATKIIYKAEER